MKKSILITALIFQCFSVFSQKILKLKPSGAYGEDAEIATSYGCTPSFSSAPWETLNYGTSVELNYAMWTYSALGCGNGVQRSLIRFKGLDTTTIPLSSIISAKLNFYGVSSSGNWGTSYFSGSPYPLTNEGWVERVTGSWTESTVTWNTQPTTTTSNRAAISVSAARFGWNTSIDVTTLVNDIIASGSNNGFMLRLNTEGIYRRVTFASSDNTDTALFPELVITYSDPCAGTVADFVDTATSCYTFDFLDKTVAKDSGIVSWNWDFGDLSGSTLKNPTHTYADYGTYNVRLIATDSGGCKDTIMKPITIAYRHFADAGRDTTLCLTNGLATTFLRGNGGLYYSWSPSALVVSPTSKNTFATVSAATSFLLNVTDSFGCKDKDTVVVNLFPNATIKNSPKDTTVCQGATLQLNASGLKTYQWFPASQVDSANKSNPKTTVTSPKILIVQGTDINGCTSMDTVTLRVHLPVMLSINPRNPIICEGDTIQVNVSGATTYKWYPSEGMSSDSIANPKINVNGTKTYVVKGTSTNGCIGTDSITVNSYPLPKVDAYAFANANIVRCQGDIVTLNVTGASRYQWSPAEYCETPTSASTIVHPTANTVFTVVGINDNGCATSDTIAVLYDGKEKAIVPNSFTPNNDQINDRVGVLDDCNIKFLSMDIFNRWGQIVFSGYNLSEKWDGTKDGKPCEVGTYFYLIKAWKLNGEPINFKGDITLIR